MVYVMKSNWTPPLATGSHMCCRHLHTWIVTASCRTKVRVDLTLTQPQDLDWRARAAARAPTLRVISPFWNFQLRRRVFCLLSNTSIVSLLRPEQSETNQNHFDCWLAHRPRLHRSKFDSTTQSKYGKIYHSRSMCMSHSLLSLLTPLFLRCFYISLQSFWELNQSKHVPVNSSSQSPGVKKISMVLSRSSNTSLWHPVLSPVLLFWLPCPLKQRAMKMKFYEADDYTALNILRCLAINVFSFTRQSSTTPYEMTGEAKHVETTCLCWTATSPDHEKPLPEQCSTENGEYDMNILLSPIVLALVSTTTCIRVVRSSQFCRVDLTSVVRSMFL